MSNPTTTTPVVAAPIPPKWAKDYDLSELAEILRKKTHPGEGYRRIKGAELAALQGYFESESRKLLRSHFGRNVQRGVWLWPLKPGTGTNKMRVELSETSVWFLAGMALTLQNLLMKSWGLPWQTPLGTMKAIPCTTP